MQRHRPPRVRHSITPELNQEPRPSPIPTGADLAIDMLLEEPCLKLKTEAKAARILRESYG